MRLRALTLAVAIAAPLVAYGDELAAEVEVRILKTAELELGRVEKALGDQPGVDAAAVANVTLPLQTAIEEDLGRGPQKLQPRAIFEACVARLKKGESPAVIAKALVDMHRRGDFARPAAAAEPAVKKVASFVFDKERIRSPDPHLPTSFKAAPGEHLKGIYQICVDVAGKVTKVTTVQSLSGADQTVMEQIRTTWLYKPQPVPVCTVRTFVFQFN